MTTTDSESAAPAGTTRTSRGAALGLLALGNVCWAGAYVSGKVALERLNWVELNTLRFALAALVMAPVLWRGRRLLAGELRDRRALFALLRLALLGFVLNKGFEYAGLTLSTASDTALLIATESLFTALLSWIVLKERATRAGVAALLVGLAGVYLIVERGLAPNLGGPGGAGRIAGDLLVVLSLVFEAGYTVTGKSALSRLPPLLITGVSIAGGLLFWLPASAVVVARQGWPTLAPLTVVSVAYLALIVTVAGYWMWFRALTVVPASLAAPFLFIQPLLGAALAVWLLREALTWATLAGAALIVASLLLVAGESRRQPRAAPDPHPPLPESTEAVP
ncbi:MAG TPA: DMT family transporter [Ktedonobacterales bacterium]|nr:DMT family transporter [Ktedonobacterales bacterium]